METTVHAPWMTTPATRAVVEALTAGGADVRFVGGCVRDALLGRESSDIDIGTPDPPEHVLALLEGAGIETRTVPRGIEHGTVTALAGGERYEITTLRRDERTDGRHAQVAFTDDWREDAARRDFTINAMSATPDGMRYTTISADKKTSRPGACASSATPPPASPRTTCASSASSASMPGTARVRRTRTALNACRVAAHTLPLLSASSGYKVPRDYVREVQKLLAAPQPDSTACVRCGTPVFSLRVAAGGATDHEPLSRLVTVREESLAQADPIRRLACPQLRQRRG